MSGLRRHVPEIAVTWALDSPERLWQAIDGTLCFADISGFTALAERLAQRGRIGGEELVETLSRVFGGMLDSARERDGMLLKFGGDALLFLFEGEDHALRAASTAVEMRQALRKAVEIPTSVGPLKLKMSVGLHSGTIHLFLVGSTHRELVLAGPDASLAAATESAANAGEIGISPATAARLPAGAVRAREDGLLLLKWRKPPVPPRGASPPRAASAELIRGLFPRRLGEVLERGAPEPEHRVACIAFVRFSGTDGLLEREGPDAVAAALQSTVGTAQRIFADEDITLLAVDIDKDGGKLFLGSGVPLASEDDEGRMLRALRRLADAGTPLPLQIGVNRGHVFAAEVGTSRRAAYSAMGDTTNTAARICAKAPPGELYAHPSVLVHSRSRYATEAAGPFLFKGKKTPQAVYRVGEETGLRESMDEAAELPLVGRREELRVLAEAVDDFAIGIGGTVCVSGAAGLGKSRLLRVAVERLTSVPALRLRAELYGANNPYRVFRDPVRALLGIERGEPAAMRTQLAAGVARLDASLLPYLSLLGEVVHLEVEPTPEAAAIEPRFRQDRIADQLIRLLERAHEGPQLLVAEDTQWADAASTHLLGRLAAACASRPWLMLVARRSDEGGFTPADARHIELGPMPPEELAALINQATVSAPLRPHELDLVVRRASGNPLYAEEIVRAARRMGSIEAVPDSLEAAIAAQVDALDPVARRVLRYATVLGRSFALSTLEALLAREDLAADGATLARLDGFLEPDGDARLRFRVGLLRKTVYEGLAFRLRIRLHREAGEAIERLERDPAAHADNLAMHFSTAGDFERAWRYARLAADRAARAYANADAARSYRMALDAARRLPGVPAAERAAVWTRLGDTCHRAGMFDSSLEAYRQAYRLVGDDPVARAELRRLRALARERASAFRTALSELSSGTRLLAGIDTLPARRMRARLAAQAAMIRFAQERYRDALEQGLAAAEAAREADEQEALALALVAAGSAQLSMGAGGAERLHEALGIYQALGDLSSEAMVRGNLGAGAFLEGRWDEALDWFESDRAARLKAGNPVGAANAASNCGEIYAKQGRLDEAEPQLRDAIRVMRASGFHDGAAYAEIQLGRVLVERGAAQQADELLARVRAELMEFGRKTSAFEAATVQALARVRLGQAQAALELIEQAAEGAGGATGLLAPQAAESRATALAALGRPAEAQEALAAGLDATIEMGLRYEEGRLRQLRSTVRRGAGLDADPVDLQVATEILGALGVRSTPSAPTIN
jgi:class 3 adenylate cyclase/tetratricopeptide (TPR) repeat protein